MTVRLRLQRHGARKRPFYRVVAADQRAPRDGRFIEMLGTYDPMVEPPAIRLHEERVDYWIGVGAQPTDTVWSLIRKVRSGTGINLSVEGAEEAARAARSAARREATEAARKAASEAAAKAEEARKKAEEEAAAAAAAEKAEAEAAAKAEADAAEAAATAEAAGAEEAATDEAAPEEAATEEAGEEKTDGE